jgi:hypothetical protein
MKIEITYQKGEAPKIQIDGQKAHEYALSVSQVSEAVRLELMREAGFKDDSINSPARPRITVHAPTEPEEWRKISKLVHELWPGAISKNCIVGSMIYTPLKKG